MELNVAPIDANDLMSLSQEIEGLDELAREYLMREWLKYKLKDCSGPEESKNIIPSLDKQSSSSAATIKRIQEIIGGDVSDAITVDDQLENILGALELLCSRLELEEKTYSAKSIYDRVVAIEEERKSFKIRTDECIDHMIETVLAALNPDEIQMQIGDAPFARWSLSKNRMCRVLKEKHERLSLYQRDGRFSRDFWIDFKLGRRRTS